MNKKQLTVIGVLFGLILIPLLGRAAWQVSDTSLSDVTPTEYNAIVRTLWDVYRNQTSDFWGIGEKNPDVALDVNGAIKVGDSGQICTIDTRGVISYHIESGDFQNHFWGCAKNADNGQWIWKKLDGIGS